jgi:hypothetical protein
MVKQRHLRLRPDVDRQVIKEESYRNAFHQVKALRFVQQLEELPRNPDGSPVLCRWSNKLALAIDDWLDGLTDVLVADGDNNGEEFINKLSEALHAMDRVLVKKLFEDALLKKLFVDESEIFP